jgi:hypothetical protein
MTVRWRSRRRAVQKIALSYDELMLIYKSLQAVKTLQALPPEDELLEDTIDVVDQALSLSDRR